HAAGTVPTRTVAYDGENRVISFAGRTFVYDAFSRRTVKIHTAAAVAEYFFYDGWSRAAWRAARPTGSAAPARRVAKPGGGGAINPTVKYGGPVSGTPTLSRAYLWGLDLSGTFQGAGGVGGHLAVDFVGSGVYYPLADGNG